MRIVKLAMLLALPLAASVAAQPPRPAAPRPCVLMPRQVATPAVPRPRDRCAPHAFPRSER